MTNDIYLIGEIGWEVNLASVIDQVSKSDSEKPLNVHIHSGGGSVYDGLAIYNYLKGLDQEVNTMSSGLVASIASVIFLAGKKESRKINNTDSFLIHLPMSWSDGNAVDFEKTAKELRDIEDKMSNIYASETDLTKEEALELMGKDEMMDVNFLKEKGFVNEIIEFKAVANFYNNKKENKMSDQLTKKDAEGLFAKFEKTLTAVFGPKITNKIVQDANGMEINFTDVPEDGNPALGDSATIDGEAADGSYVMPSGDTFVFAAGDLTEIIKEEKEDAEMLLEASEAKVKELEAELVAEKENTATMTAKMETIQNDFKELKSKITSNFKVDGKKKPEGERNKSRTFRNKKQ